MIGQSISHYRIVDKLDVGGMAVVYRAEDVKLGRPVALKFLPASLSDDEEAKERLILEAKAASSLDHPNICTIYEVGETEEGRIFIAMAYYEGETLHRKIARGPLPVDDAVGYARQVAAGLAKSHELDIIHRDIKPANVFVTRDGQVKILDFGLAKVLGDGVTLTGLAQGTPAYMAPERIKNEKANPRTDLWSLGVVLYESLAGRRPFEGANVAEIIHAVRTREPEDLRFVRPEVPARLSSIVRRLLRKNPRFRYRDCPQLLGDLEALAPSPSGILTRPSISQVLRPAGFGPARSPRRWLLPALLLAAVTVLAFLVPWSRPPDEAGNPPVTLAERPALAIVFVESSSINQRMVFSMSRSQRIRVLDSERTRRAVEELGGATELYDSAAAVRRLAERLGADQVVVGRLVKAEDGMQIEVRIHNATGEILANLRLDIPDEEHILSQIDSLSEDILRQRFEVPRYGRDPDLDQEQVNWPSSEAWHLYAAGMEKHLVYDEAAAVPLFRQAVEIDPGFAAAWAKLAVAQRGLGRPQWLQSVQRALDGIENLTPRERHYVRGLYASRDASYWATAIEEFEKAVDAAPDYFAAHQNLALLKSELERYGEAVAHGEILVDFRAPYSGVYATLAESYAGQGELGKADELLRSLILERPDDYVAHCALGRLALRTGDFEEALARFAEAEAIQPATAFTLTGLCDAHLLLGEWGEALRVASNPRLSLREPSLRAAAYRCRLLAELYQGHSAAALELADEATDQVPAGPLRAAMHLHAARSHLLRGEASAAFQRARSAREESGGHPVRAWALFYGATAGIRDRDLAEAERLAAELDALAESSAGVQMRRLHDHVRALLDMARGNTRPALALLETAESLLPARGLRSSHHLPDHVPLWFSLAGAYRANGDSRRAIASLERILASGEERVDHPGVYAWSLARLGRLHEEEGETAVARHYYDRFEELWRDGDLGREDLPRFP